MTLRHRVCFLALVVNARLNRIFNIFRAMFVAMCYDQSLKQYLITATCAYVRTLGPTTYHICVFETLRRLLVAGN